MFFTLDTARQSLFNIEIEMSGEHNATQVFTTKITPVQDPLLSFDPPPKKIDNRVDGQVYTPADGPFVVCQYNGLQVAKHICDSFGDRQKSEGRSAKASNYTTGRGCGQKLETVRHHGFSRSVGISGTTCTIQGPRGPSHSLEPLSIPATMHLSGDANDTRPLQPTP